jgi:hypothetical protein
MVGFTMLTGVAFADTALSQSTDPTATLGAGTLNISTAMTTGTFVGTLNGAAQTLTADNASAGTPFSGFSINDATGSGLGWTVTMQATQFSNTTTDTASSSYGKTLADNSLTMPLLTVSGNIGSSAVPSSLTAAAKIDNAPGVVMVTAAAGEGMGTYDFSAAAAAPWTLSVPANTYVGTYTSTVTTTLATTVVG